jgi:hypothetical protein
MKKIFVIITLGLLLVALGCVGQAPEGVIVTNKELSGCIPSISITKASWVGNNLVVNGEIANSCSDIIDDVTIKGQYYAGDGKELGIDRATVKDIDLKKNKSFAISFPDPEKKVSKYELSVDRIYWKQ